MDQAEVKMRLDKLCEKYPDELGTSIKTREKNHHYFVTHGPDTYGRFKSQFGAFFDIINRILLGINYIDKKDWPKYRSLQYIIITNNLICLRNSVECILNGYYPDSLTLARVNLEALVRCIWISCHPKDYESGVLKVNGSKVSFNYKNFVTQELKLDWVEHKMWSLNTHANQMATVKDWIAVHTKTKEYPICLELKFDKFMIEICINSIKFLELLNLKFVVEILTTSTNDLHLPPALLNDAKEYIQYTENTIRSHEKGYWPKIPNDIRDLLTLVNNMDNDENGDFKEKWIKIRQNKPVSKVI